MTTTNNTMRASFHGKLPQHHYYRVISGPTSFVHDNKEVFYVTVLPESVDLDDPNAEILASEYDLSKVDFLRTKQMCQSIRVYIGERCYEYRAQAQHHGYDELVHIVLELKV